jgi:RNA polymerase sigma-70 factor (ECF subfamily)
MVAQISSSPSPLLAADRAAHRGFAREEAQHDEALVRRFIAGDQAAFVEIVTRYRGKMLAVAQTMLRNHADAEEIAQDTFIRAHRSLPFFRGDASLSSWLHCITLNLSRNRYWYFFRRRRHATQSLDSAINADTDATYADLVACDAPGPVREVATLEFATLIAESMAKLNVQQREILTLRNDRQYSYGKIARTLDIKIGTVKSRVGRARKALRLSLAKAYPEFDPEDSPFGWFDSVRPSGRQQGVCA